MATKTNASLSEYSGLAGGVGGKTAFTYVAVGTGTNAETAARTTLYGEVTGSGLGRASVTPTQQTTVQTNDTLQLVKTWTVSGTVAIAEVGVFNASPNGTMAFRDKLSAVKNVVDGDTYQLTAKIVFA